MSRSQVGKGGGGRCPLNSHGVKNGFRLVMGVGLQAIYGL